MAREDKRPCLPVMEESPSDKSGVPIHKGLEGETTASKNATPALTLKDPSGNFIYGKTNADGEQIVSLEGGDYAGLYDYGEDEDGDAASYVDLATITGQIAYEYREISAVVSCFRDSMFRIVYIDDADGTPVETILSEFFVGNGNPSLAFQLDNFVKDTTGGTGTQEFVLRGKNLNATSSLQGTLAMKEVQQ